MDSIDILGVYLVYPQVRRAFIAIVNDLFRERLYKDMLMHLDNVICFSEDFDNHISTFQRIFNKLLKSTLKLKAPLGKFLFSKVIYISDIVSEARVSPDLQTFYRILAYLQPKSAMPVKQI